MTIKFADIEFAFDFVIFDSYGNHEVYLCTETGKFYYSSDLIDEEEEPLPDDIYENPKYILLPSKRELDLGKILVLQFAEEYLPNEYPLVSSMFHKKSAYSRFKSLLERKNLLDKWHDYEQQAQTNALKTWCKDNNIKYRD